MEMVCAARGGGGEDESKTGMDLVQHALNNLDCPTGREMSLGRKDTHSPRAVIKRTVLSYSFFLLEEGSYTMFMKNQQNI